MCENHRCISILLRCDGFDHCGDKSDEAGDCKRSFVKTGFLGSFYDFRTAAAVFVICSLGNARICICVFAATNVGSTLGITCLIFGVIVLLYRINVNNQNHRRYQNHLETINAILGEQKPHNVTLCPIVMFSEEGSLRSEVEEEMIIADNPPDYEPPPNYDEIVIKACCSQNSPPPAYSSHHHKRVVNEKWFQWLSVGKSFGRKEERCGRLVVSYSDGNLEKCFGFNGGDREEGVIRRSQSIDSFMS